MKRQAFNPYLPDWEYIPDGEPRVFGGRLYIYGSHDRYNGQDFCQEDYVTWSAPVDDLAAWRHEGVIYRRDQDPENPGGRYPLYAPDVCRGADGRFYLYYAPQGADVLGVAVSDSPAGPFAFCGHVTCPDGHLLGRRAGDPIPFDPGVLVEEDGTAWLYFGFAPKRPQDGPVPHAGGAFVLRLEGDMRTAATQPQPVVLTGVPPCAQPHRGHGFFEASSVRKIGSRYYFLYSSQNSHELCYALGDAPAGPFAYGGVILSNGDIGYGGRTDPTNYHGNNHGGLVELGGRWYIFGHRMTNGHSYSRQGFAQAVDILPDGRIPQVEMTSCGLNGGPLEGAGTYPARIACNLWSGQGALRVSDPAFVQNKHRHPAFRQEGTGRRAVQYIANLRAGSTAGFKYFRPGGAGTVSAVCRGSGGSLLIYTDPASAPCAQIPLQSSESWQKSTAVPFAPPDGVFPLYFTAQTDGALDFLEFSLE